MGKVGRFVTKRILFLNLRGALTKDMQAVMWALKVPNFWVTAGAQHLRIPTIPSPPGAESAPHRGGNAREKTSETRYDRCEGRYRTGDYAREKTSETRYDRCEGRYRTGDYAREKTSETRYDRCDGRDPTGDAARGNTPHM